MIIMYCVSTKQFNVHTHTLAILGFVLGEVQLPEMLLTPSDKHRKHLQGNRNIHVQLYVLKDESSY